jgi:hypothetical protein
MINADTRKNTLMGLILDGNLVKKPDGASSDSFVWVDGVFRNFDALTLLQLGLCGLVGWGVRGQGEETTFASVTHAEIPTKKLDKNESTFQLGVTHHPRPIIPCIKSHSYSFS